MVSRQSGFRPRGTEAGGPEAANKKPSGMRRVDSVRLVAPAGATSAFAIHLARIGRLAWASTQFVMGLYANRLLARPSKQECSLGCTVLLHLGCGHAFPVGPADSVPAAGAAFGNSP